MSVQYGLFDSSSDPEARAEAPRTRPAARTAFCEWCRVEYEVGPHFPYCGGDCHNAARKARQETKQLHAELAAKEEGQAKALEKHAHEAELAARETVLYLGAHGTAIVSDIRQECERKGIRLDWTKKWVGGLFARSPLFEPVPDTFDKAYHEGSRGRTVRVYRLSDEGRAELARLREKK